VSASPKVCGELSDFVLQHRNVVSVLIRFYLSAAIGSRTSKYSASFNLMDSRNSESFAEIGVRDLDRHLFQF
jgi:hypothetical protein